MSAAAVLRRPRENAATFARHLQLDHLQLQRRTYRYSRESVNTGDHRPRRGPIPRSGPRSGPASEPRIYPRPTDPPRGFLSSFRSPPANKRRGAIRPDFFDSTTHIHRLPVQFCRGLPQTLILSRKDGIPIPKNESLVDEPGAAFQAKMLTYVQVVSAPTVDTPSACVLMHFDNRRYIFGQIGEGCQRLITSRKMGLSKLDEFFISGPVTWKSVGGLLGMILTIADVVSVQRAELDVAAKKKKKWSASNPFAIPSLKIYGAENINHMLATARQFIFRKGMPLRLTEIAHNTHLGDTQGRTPDFEDANIKVWYVSVRSDKEAEPHGRKRSHDDMVAEDDGKSSQTQNAERRQTERDLVKSVVNNMFDSDWELDALVETTLHKVKLPATIFVKDKDGQFKKYDGPMPGGDKPVPDIPVFTRTPWPATKIDALPRTSPSRQSLSYIVKSQSRRGKFNPEEALKYGVPRHEFSKLTKGETVKGKDGVDVTPEMVVGATIEGRGIAFIDLPDISYVGPFLDRPEWADDSIMNTIDVFYWSLGRDVVRDERIQDFMKQRKDRMHEVFSPDVAPNGAPLVGAAMQSIDMHRIDPHRFPLPVYDNKKRVSGEEPYQVARIGKKVQLAPRVEVQENEVLADIFVNKRPWQPQLTKLIDQARKTVSDPDFLEKIQAAEKDLALYRDVEVIPLGTGSAMPSKHRNVSATLVRVPGYGSYLFDCGENTTGQLRRMYGVEQADEILSELKVIWISHLHADHHLGTVSVIKAWRDATTSKRVDGVLPRLTVASHRGFSDWLHEYADVEDFGFDRVRVLTVRGPQARETIQEPIIFSSQEAGLERIDAVRVDHCFGSLACVFTWPNGLRVAYSGDCRPSRVFAEVGEGCTLLIHEATLDDELREDAFAKRHCTMGEALGIAKKMRAKRVLLTHFSQRYPKIPNELSQGARTSAQADEQVVLMAFDQMQVKLGDFSKAAAFLPAIRQLLDSSSGDD